MSNNAPDYEDNLAFPPQEIKSQDDIKHQEIRSSEVLLEALDKCEKLEQENQQLKELLKECRDYLEDDSPLSMRSMIEEIDNAIGEK